MSKPKVTVKWNKNALRDAVNEAVDDFLENTGVEYECPECCSPIVLKIGQNVCDTCGFVINAEKGEVEL